MTAPVAAGSQVLRAYQVTTVENVRREYGSGAESAVFVLPTGGGKTVAFTYIVEHAAALGRRVLILAHRAEILEQIQNALIFAGVPYGVIAPGCPETEDPVQVASVASLARSRRLERWAAKFDFIVVDECHHVVAGSWAKILASQPGAKILGVTATPERADGRGLGEIFDVMVEGPVIAELIRDGWLSPFVVFEPTAPDMSAAKIRAGDFSIEDQREAMNSVVIGAAVVEYQRICPGVPAVAFCVDIEHSMAFAERFCAAGVMAAHVDGETPSAERRALIAALGNGGLEVLCNCGLISEGVDVPAIGAAILLRPTSSLALHLQQIGRALRPAPGKVAKILDFAGNCGRHGLPDEPREWSLDAKPRRQREGPEGQRLRRCPSCTALNQPSAHSCANCGGDLRTPRERREVEMALRLAEQREAEAKVRLMSYGARLAWARGDEQRLRFVERICGYKRGWTWHRLRELAEQSIAARAS